MQRVESAECLVVVDDRRGRVEAVGEEWLEARHGRGCLAKKLGRDRLVADEVGLPEGVDGPPEDGPTEGDRPDELRRDVLDGRVEVRWQHQAVAMDGRRG